HGRRARLSNKKLRAISLAKQRNSPTITTKSGTFSPLPVVRAGGLGRFKEFFMARKPHLQPVAAASAASAVSPAQSAAPGAALAPMAPAAPTRMPCRALLGPRPLIDGEDGTNYDVILERISADVAPKDFVEEIWVRNVV